VRYRWLQASANVSLAPIVKAFRGVVSRQLPRAKARSLQGTLFKLGRPGLATIHRGSVTQRSLRRTGECFLKFAALQGRDHIVGRMAHAGER